MAKSPSRAARLRGARSQIHRVQAPQMIEVPDWTGVPDEVRKFNENYQPDPNRIPLAIWLESLRLLALTLTAAFHRMNPKSDRRVISYLAGFLFWFLNCPLRIDHSAPLRLEEIVTAVADPVEAYIATLTNKAPTTQATYRYMLRQAISGLTPHSAPRVIPRSELVNEPYSVAQAEALVWAAHGQPTEARRRTAMAMVSVGLGAGLDQRECGHLTPEHIITDSKGLKIRITKGSRKPRIIPVRSQVASMLQEFVEIHYATGKSATDALFGVNPGTRNAVTDALKRVTAADGSIVPLDPARLRATWLLAMMSAPIPFPTLFYLAGVNAPSSIGEMLVFLNPDHESYRDAIVNAPLVEPFGGVR